MGKTTSLRDVVTTAMNNKSHVAREVSGLAKLTIGLPKSSVIPLFFEVVYHWRQFCITDPLLPENFWFS
jgi:hypothetical protein